MTVWTGTQRPFGVRTEVAQAFRIAEDRVRVIVPDMGSGYGGKHTGEQAIEAARLARAAGKPVKLVYTRAEEFMWGYFRPARRDRRRGRRRRGGPALGVGVRQLQLGLGRTADAVHRAEPARRSRTRSDSPLRQGSYRGLAATANHYAREMHMDALARKMGVDPVEFRRRTSRSRDCARCWTPSPIASAGRGRGRGEESVGIACGTEKGSFVATAAEVSEDRRPASPSIA